MVHIWHEDSKDSSTTQFWNFLKKSNISILLNGADIEGFGGPLGFQVTKTVFGLCWTCDHSVKNNHRNACKQCYLNQQKFKKTSQVKACDLWHGTDVHRILH